MEYNSFMEALKGKQHKIDKNKNGKVDSNDFELLRKEETEELDEIHRMKTKLNKLDAVSNKSVARQKLSNLMKSGKAKGALVANKMRTLNMGDDVDQEDLDALHEVLSKDAKAGDWIHDFVHSTNPKFEGKTKKERIKMALGAYYDTNKKKDGVSEGYQSHSGPSHGHAYGGSGFGRREREDDEYHVPDPVPSRSHAPVAPVPDKKYIKGTPENKALKASRKPINGHPTNIKEEDTKVMHVHHNGEKIGETGVDPEASPGNGKWFAKHYKSKMDSVGFDSRKEAEAEVHAAHGIKEEAEQIEERNKQNAMMRKTMDASRGARYKLNNPVPDAEPEHKTAQAHNKAIGRALRNEDKMTTQKDKNGKLISFKYEGDWKKTTKADAKKDPAGKVANMAGQSMQKMAQANEAKDPGEYDQEGDMAKTQLRSIKYHADELHEMLSDNDNLPEWVQSKLTLAQDYLQTVCDYMYSKDEVNEAAYAGLEKEDKPGKIKTAVVKLHPKGVEGETVEGWKDAKKAVAEAVQKVDIPAYLRKAKGDTPLKMDDLKRKDTLSDAENLKRNRGVKESFDDEGNLISNKVSYKEFMLEYTPGPGGVTQIKGRSYGANYSDPEGADDADDNKPIKPAAEKRGRGRPAGAKSGARKITGTSKLMNK